MALEHADRFPAATHREKHGRTNFVKAVFTLVQAYVIRPLRRQHLHDVDGRSRQIRSRPVGTGCENLRIIAKQRHLACTSFTTQHSEFEDEEPLVDCRQPFRDLARRRQVLAHLYFQYGLHYFNGAAEPVFDLDIEPGVDTAIDVLNREVVNDDKRQHGEPYEHADHARLEPRTRNVLAVVAQQADEVADHEH